jgi:hypothetical protein
MKKTFNGLHPGAALLCAGLVLGCGKPTPPQLQTDGGPYENAHDGIRLQPPKGWSQTGLAREQTGHVPKEVPMVKYRLFDGKRIGVFRLSIVDLPEGASVEEFLKEKSPGLEDWKPDPPKSTPAEVGGRPGIRMTFRGKWEMQPAIKEVLAVRSSTRVYSFTGIYGVNDKAARDAIRQAVASVIWTTK